jgi:hypothetical protein
VRLVGHVAEEIQNVGRKTRHIWEDNIKTDLKEMV